MILVERMVVEMVDCLAVKLVWTQVVWLGKLMVELMVQMRAASWALKMVDQIADMMVEMTADMMVE